MSKRLSLRGRSKNNTANDDSDEKLEISQPRNFQHMSHIGWTDEATFELRNIPPEWKRFFQAAHIRKRDLEDPDTRKAIFAVLFNQGEVSESEYDDMPGLGPIIYQSGVEETEEPPAEEQAPSYDEAAAQDANYEQGYAEGGEGEYYDESGQQGEGEYYEGEQHEEGEYYEGDQQEGGYAEGEQQEGEYAEGEQQEGEYAEGEQQGEEYAEGDQQEGEEYAEGDQQEEGEYAEGDQQEEEYAEGDQQEEEEEQPPPTPSRDAPATDTGYGEEYNEQGEEYDEQYDQHEGGRYLENEEDPNDEDVRMSLLA